MDAFTVRYDESNNTWVQLKLMRDVKPSQDHSRILRVQFQPRRLEEYGRGDHAPRIVPWWLQAGIRKHYDREIPTMNVQAHRYEGNLEATMLLTWDKQLVGVFDVETCELGWYVEWTEFKMYFRRFLTPAPGYAGHVDDDGLRFFGRKCVLAPASFGLTGELPGEETRTHKIAMECARNGVKP